MWESFFYLVTHDIYIYKSYISLLDEGKKNREYK